MENQEEVKKAIVERFDNLQPEIKDAIMSSNYEKNLYDIGTKYKLSIEQMGKLEFNTTLVLLGQTHPDEYNAELAQDLNLPKDVVDNIVNDVNEKIMKNIIEIIKKNFAEDDKEEEAFKEVPLPPVEKSEDENGTTPTPPPSNTKLVTESIPEEHHEIYKNTGIEILNDDKDKIEEAKKDTVLMTSGMNMLKDKLDGMTISKSKVSDYSLPKMGGVKNPSANTSPTPNQNMDIPKPQRDPYHEIIE